MTDAERTIADGEPTETERHLRNLLAWWQQAAAQDRADAILLRQGIVALNERLALESERSEEWKARAEKAEAELSRLNLPLVRKNEAGGE